MTSYQIQLQGSMLKYLIDNENILYSMYFDIRTKAREFSRWIEIFGFKKI